MVVLSMAPYAPHLAEELWEFLGHGESLAYESWPEWDEQVRGLVAFKGWTQLEKLLASRRAVHSCSI